MMIEVTGGGRKVIRLHGTRKEKTGCKEESTNE